ncbi:MAG: shikimate dehydrogenase [Rhodanobacter sp.]
MAIAQFAVFGHPIAHSLSPRIHQAFARQFGITLDFRAIDAAPKDFSTAVQAFFAGGAVGANVTLPHKAAAFALAHARSAAAMRVGAANVLTRCNDGTLAAHNTDGAGLVRDLSERHDADLRGHTALLLGAGGAAWGVAWNLLDAGVHSLVIANRSPEAAGRLADAIGDAQRARAQPWPALAAAGSFDLIVNATSAGVLGQTLHLPPSLVTARTLCYDLGYGPAANGFLAWAQAAHARRAVDGLGMLLETAADAFALWHGRRPATEPVYRVLRGQR